MYAKVKIYLVSKNIRISWLQKIEYAYQFLDFSFVISMIWYFCIIIHIWIYIVYKSQ